MCRVVDSGKGREQRRWRVSAEPVARPWGEGEPPKGGEAGASKGGAKRCAAMRESLWLERAAGDGSGATEARRREGGVVPFAPASVARSDRRERRRQGSSPEGRRPRSGLRGAGRGEAAPGGIEPGDRSEGPGGRPYLPTGAADDTGKNSTIYGDDPDSKGREESPCKAASDRLLAELNAISGREKSRGMFEGGAGNAAAICRSQNGEPTR